MFVYLHSTRDGVAWECPDAYNGNCLSKFFLHVFSSCTISHLWLCRLQKVSLVIFQMVHLNVVGGGWRFNNVFCINCLQTNIEYQTKYQQSIKSYTKTQNLWTLFTKLVNIISSRVWKYIANWILQMGVRSGAPEEWASPAPHAAPAIIFIVTWTIYRPVGLCTRTH